MPSHEGPGTLLTHHRRTGSDIRALQCPRPLAAEALAVVAQRHGGALADADPALLRPFAAHEHAPPFPVHRVEPHGDALLIPHAVVEQEVAEGRVAFGALDMRVTHTFANADRYQSSRTPHIVCPYDYYEGDLKQELYALLSRTEEPRCGVATIDEPGTLQGVWFGPGSDVVVGWEKHLSFVPDNFDPRTSVIAVGGTFTEPGRVEFTPVSSGTVNRAFREVTADGTLYCYQRDGSGRHERVQNPDLLSGKILVLLVSAEQLQVERQAGQCGAGDALSVPTTYFRWGVCAPRGETKLSGLRARPRFHRPSGRETADLRICVRSTRGPAQSRIGPRELSSDRNL